MELRHLRYFVAVAEESSFRRAAERLRVAQPALSRQIRDLEEELGVQLFERSKAAVRLNPAGEFYLKEARGIVARSAEAAVAVRRFADANSRTLNLGYITPALGSFLATSLQVFTQKHAQVRVNLFELNPAAQIAALRSGCLDIALIGHACPSLGDEFALAVIHEIPVQVVLPETHPLAREERIPLVALKQEPFIGYDEQTFPGRNEFVASVCAEAGFTPRFVKTADGLATALTLVGSGAGVALMPEEVNDLPHPHAVFRPLKPGALNVAFCAATRKDEARPLVATMLQEFRLQAAS